MVDIKSEQNFLIAFGKYKTFLKRFITKILINSQDVDDIYQETFLRSYKVSKERDIEHPKSFFLKVARNIVISDWRRLGNKLNDSIDDYDIVDFNSKNESLEKSILADEKMEIMLKAISRLPDKCKKAVVLRKVYGLGTTEIAKKMGISPPSVSNYITRGMCAYNDALTDYENENENENENEACFYKEIDKND